MTLLEQIQDQLHQLPPEKQSEVLDFILFLQQWLKVAKPSVKPLHEHPAFGSWRGRKIDALNYQRHLRAEWDEHA